MFSEFVFVGLFVYLFFSSDLIIFVCVEMCFLEQGVSAQLFLSVHKTKDITFILVLMTGGGFTIIICVLCHSLDIQ